MISLPIRVLLFIALLVLPYRRILPPVSFRPPCLTTILNTALPARY